MAIKHKRTTTPAYVWQASDLVPGQLGINTNDGTVHFKKADNTIQTLPTAGGSSETLSILVHVVPEF